jgi:hypothetical protein
LLCSFSSLFQYSGKRRELPPARREPSSERIVPCRAHCSLATLGFRAQFLEVVHSGSLLNYACTTGKPTAISSETTQTAGVCALDTLRWGGKLVRLATVEIGIRGSVVACTGIPALRVSLLGRSWLRSDYVTGPRKHGQVRRPACAHEDGPEHIEASRFVDRTCERLGIAHAALEGRDGLTRILDVARLADFLLVRHECLKEQEATLRYGGAPIERGGG